MAHGVGAFSKHSPLPPISLHGAEADAMTKAAAGDDVRQPAVARRRRVRIAVPWVRPGRGRLCSGPLDWPRAARSRAQTWRLTHGVCLLQAGPVVDPELLRSRIEQVGRVRPLHSSPPPPSANLPKRASYAVHAGCTGTGTWHGCEGVNSGAGSVWEGGREQLLCLWQRAASDARPEAGGRALNIAAHSGCLALACC